MKVARSLAKFEALREALDGRVALVPTMGALHAGHMSLVDLAAKSASHVIAYVFVNPTQFAEGEDLETYPRTLEADLAMLEAAGVDLVFLPSVQDIYPDGAAIKVKAGAAAQGLESDFRPAFFDGVCSVLHRFFKIVKPDAAVFGEKDFQQLQVVREMVAAQGMGVEVVGAASARDEFGLALSSRNAYLSAAELEIARMMNQVIYNVAHQVRSLELGDVSGVLDEAREMLLTAGFDRVDYVAYRVDWRRVLAAAWVGKTRLIDNCGV